MKNPLVSVIVPTKNSEQFLDRCLSSIKIQTYKNMEIIVVDNSSTDETKKIARKFTKDVFNKGFERSAQRNFGAEKSKGEYCLFIDSDMELSEKVLEECVRLLESYNVSKVNKELGGIIIPEKSFGKGFWARCKALERSFYIGVDWIEAARFYSKKVFMELGGFDENLISGEDWDLNQKVRKKYNILRINSFIKHNEGDLSFLQLLKKKMYYGTKLGNYSSKEENRKNFKNQSSAVMRYKLFFSDPKRLFSNPIIGMGMLFLKTSEFVVLGLGFILKK